MKFSKIHHPGTQDLKSLPGFFYSDLRSRWKVAFGTEPRGNLSRRLIILALAYDLQVKAYGGPTKATTKRLISLSGPAATPRRKPPPRLSPGTRLMREWRGVVHVVDVTAEGFLWNGRCFRSLSAIARTITGAHWNGLAFFGLRKRREPRRSDGNTPASNEAA